MEGTSAAIEWDDGTFERVLKRLQREGTIEAAGVRISPERLARVLEAAPEDPGRPGRRLLGDASFVQATFEGDACFRGASFQRHAGFGRATFEGDAWFDEATFQGDAGFEGAIFQGDARFEGATFEGDAGFGGATFQRLAVFVGVSFQRYAGFEGAAFQGAAGFGGATFQGAARFGGASFQGHAGFGGATFQGARDFGPVLARMALALDRTVFAQPVRIEISAEALSCARAQFRRGVDLLVRWAEVALDDVDFAEPSMLAPRRELVPGEEAALREGHDSGGEPAPRILSVRRAKVAHLTIVGADLRACLFEGAHGLDQLRLERVRFPETPPGWQRSKRWRLPIRWTRRQAIAEEHQWRAERAGAAGWYAPEVQATSGPTAVPQAPEHIAAIYRALRKSREDSKDEPGAADFYYGEMEMRRQKPRTTPATNATQSDRLVERPAGPAERIILWLYWLVSGYGLRASRALIALGTTIALAAVVLDLSGFDPGRHPDDGTLLFAAETSISLLRAPDTTNLTAVGHVVQIVLRLAGPLFFGLALLSLRGRVKR